MEAVAQASHGFKRDLGELHVVRMNFTQGRRIYQIESALLHRLHHALNQRLAEDHPAIRQTPALRFAVTENPRGSLAFVQAQRGIAEQPAVSQDDHLHRNARLHMGGDSPAATEDFIVRVRRQH